mmetsp:Transcript_105291/g.203913  ORF Transcript_105291/g.203913 Transcript_105291/m.203913 type:complete len:197 (-) Transcript_105291:94-684(-)|eukprot:CAMPEP_0172851816 /NCGR_PEP_ID=MMETSP1075-20121228/51862_1 /TAXON_ID=2916 /ORGANISM="Ceratium fusus, Strain PA161109" /LENGTH=196 /DNA_ID=CAMNT_0013697887 /DNA_START=64 /DNA_END=654 /DNA_ORIENTATION=+
MAPLSQEVIGQLNQVGDQWQVQMIDSPCKRPSYWCYGCACPCCFTYYQRQELLEITGEKYICCAGLFPCGPLDQPQDEKCLVLEVCCCLGLALSGNRWMLQTRFLKQNDPCDDFLMCCNAALACLALCMQLFGADEDATNAITCLSEVMNTCVISCMLAQHQMEIDHIKEAHLEPRIDQILAVLPPRQQEMMKLTK